MTIESHSKPYPFGQTIDDLARRVQPDPAMISRLAATYAAQPDKKTEAQVRKVIGLPPAQ